MWTYQQTTGALLDADGKRRAAGYSGSPEGKNDPAKQDVLGVGPIPQGEYTIGEPFNSPTHGPFAMQLTPDAENHMFGRSGFLMHGDSLEHLGCASEGCIIMPRPTREAVWNGGDRRLRVVCD